MESMRLFSFMGPSFKHEFIYTHLLFIIFLVNASDRGVTNPLGSSLTKSGLLLGFKSYCIPFLNIPLSYISELFSWEESGFGHPSCHTLERRF